MPATKPIDQPSTGPANGKAKRRRHRATRPQLLTRKDLDLRTNAARDFARLVSEIERDCGGHDQLSTIERTLIEGFVGAAVHIHGLNTQLLLGQKVDLQEHTMVCSALVRIASRLGIQRRQRDVTPTLSDLLREDRQRQQAEWTS
jgi:hypothetical protein